MLNKKYHNFVKELNLIKLFTIAVLFVYFLIINIMQPLIADDFPRANIDALYNHTIISNLFYDYLNWTGRITAQLPVYIFLNKSMHFMVYFFDIINAFAICFFIFIFFKIITKDKESIISKSFLVYFVLLLTFSFWSAALGNILWKTLAMQYFWGICIGIYFYYRSFIKNKKSKLLGIFVGVFIGLYNEVYFAISFVICICYLFDCVKEKNNINNDIYFFLIPLLIAGVILLYAPGSYVRLHNVGNLSGQNNIIIILALNTFKVFVQQIFLTVVFTLSLIFVYIDTKRSHSNVDWWKIFYLVLIYFTVIPASISFAQRVCLPYYIVYGYVVFSILLNRQTIFIEFMNMHIYKLFLILLFHLLFLGGFYSYLHFQVTQRQQLIDGYHKNNIKNVRFEKIESLPNQFIVPYRDISKDPNNWTNKNYAEYYGFNTVQLY
ncbi:hypothetical protein B4919_03805 [Francisella tularensis subsp. novicida]|nr:hypothetical protein B4919_03805 [Francisella tularensis subsp. novicida]